MKLEVNRESAPAYLEVSNERYISSKEFKGIVVFDFDIDGNVKGIEFLGSQIREFFKNE